MEGYSGTPLPGKLGIKAGHQIALVNAPAGFEKTLVPMPDDVRIRRDLRARALDVIVLFAKTRSQLEAKLGTAATRLAPAGGLWIGWPKRASGVPTDLSDGVVREMGLATGLVDNKVCAIDDTWSGLRFVIRVKNRATAKP